MSIEAIATIGVGVLSVLATIVGFAGGQLRRLGDRIVTLEVAMGKRVDFDALGKVAGDLHEKANQLAQRIAKLEK